ncbi:MAG: DNA gyrase inhibitor YacG [Acidobacteria bacterium]|nr:DNA gyrase inhibitor YacG [Acidobacteriota bacterium]
MLLKCPICGKERESGENRFRPFCSERCKMLDLGNWLSGSYRIPVRNTDEDEDGDAPEKKDTDEE